MLFNFYYIFFQVGSVITPRKLIDIETNDFTPSPTTKRPIMSIVPQKKSKQILLEIEHVSFLI